MQVVKIYLKIIKLFESFQMCLLCGQKCSIIGFWVKQQLKVSCLINCVIIIFICGSNLFTKVLTIYLFHGWLGGSVIEDVLCCSA